MPKQKMLLKADKKKGKLTKAPPSTADEYLEAGVDFEEAGEKWRGGDAVKSARFFTKAIACYEEGLANFPTSFDLAYNKARIQYELTQYPKLLAQLPGALLQLLETALMSSRFALRLKQDNAEVLYTTAQILSSLAEANIANPQNQPLPLLEESLELFQRCLTIQESLFSQPQAPDMDTSEPDLEDGGASLSSDPSTAPAEEERWASVVEPVTSETLLDTVVAQLEVLTLVCGAITDSDSKIINFVEEYSSPLLQVKILAYTEDAPSDAVFTARLTSAVFISALGDANFQHGRIDASTYFNTLQEAWSFDASETAEALVFAAEASISYNSSLRNSPESQTAIASRWKVLSSAQDSLTKASKLPNVEKLAKIYLLRGDVDLLRSQLGNEGFEVARKSGAVLVKNAEKFYRGAKGLAEEKAVAVEAAVKEGVARGLGGDFDGLKIVVKEVGEAVARQSLVECWEDGLVSREELESCEI